MSIRFRPTAFGHGISRDEILSTIAYPAATVRVAPHHQSNEDGEFILYVGQYDANEPLIEVIVEVVDDGALIVFHAMLLRLATAREYGVLDFVDVELIATKQRR